MCAPKLSSATHHKILTICRFDFSATMATRRMEQIEMLVATATPAEVPNIKHLVQAREQAIQSAPISTACNVFAVPELLEMVLLHLSTKELYGIQRVCRTFKLLTERSNPLRQRLFVEYQPRQLATPSDWGLLNPRLAAGDFKHTGFTSWEPDFNETSRTLHIQVWYLLGDEYGHDGIVEEVEVRNDSWSKMNIAAMDVPVEVTFALDGWSIYESTETFSLHDGKRTFKSLIELTNTALKELTEMLRETESTRG